jgi:hypothetical protein
VYGSLDPSLTLLMHGVETDWIEEEMADDDDFRSTLHVPKKQTMKILDHIHKYQKVFETPYNNQSKEDQTLLLSYIHLSTLTHREKKDEERRTEGNQ